MEISIIGVSHLTTPIEVRERLAFTKQNLPIALQGILGHPSVKECVILSTCNRVEVIAAIENRSLAFHEITSYILKFHKMKVESIPNGFYSYYHRDAVTYLFRVSASLESMVVGEPQILGQIREAYQDAQEAGSVGPCLNMLLPHAIKAARRARTETNIAQNAVSISFAAVELAKKIFGDIQGKTILLIGAGEMSELAARHLMSNGVKRVMVANRTKSRAEEIACAFDGEAVAFDQIQEMLALADIVITSTGAPHFILTRKNIEDSLKLRKNKPIFLIDIAVPRDIDPEVNKCDNIFLFDIDDLQTVVETNLHERQKEAKKASAIIEHEVDLFMKRWSALDVVPTITLLNSYMDEIRKKELDKALSRLGPLDNGQREILEAMTTSMVKKILHTPIRKLKNVSNTEEITLLLKNTKELFGFK
ncbi:MAG: glutamyl-tRNA reductase [bacterium]